MKTQEKAIAEIITILNDYLASGDSVIPIICQILYHAHAQVGVTYEELFNCLSYIQQAEINKYCQIANKKDNAALMLMDVLNKSKSTKSIPKTHVDILKKSLDLNQDNQCETERKFYDKFMKG